MRRASGARARSKRKADFNCFEVNSAAYKFYKAGDYKNAAKILLSNKSHIAKLGKMDEGAAYAYWLLGISLFMCEKFAACEPYLLKAGRIYDDLKKSEVLNCMWWRAMSLQARNQFKRAARVLNKAIEWTEANAFTDSEWPQRMHAQVGYCYWKTKDFDAAFDAFEKSVRQSKNVPLAAVSGLVEKLMHLLSVEAKDPSHKEMLRKLLRHANKNVVRLLNQLVVPESRKEVVREKHFGAMISDPYRWLEEVHADEVKQWIAVQNQYSNSYLEAIPGRGEVLKLVHKMFSAKTLKVIYKVGPYYFSSDKPATKLFRSERPGQFSQLVLSSEDWSKNCRLSNTVVSRDGKYVAYFVMTNGSDWQTIYVKNMDTGKRVRGVIKNVHARTLTWDKNSTGFYYAAFDRGDDRCQIRYHKLHTSQAEDKVIYKFDEPDVYASISIIGNHKYLMVTTYGTKKTRHSIFLINIQNVRSRRLHVLKEQSKGFYFIGQKDDRVFFITDKNAPLFRIVSLSIREVEESAKSNRLPRFRQVLEEQPHLLKRAFKWGEFLVCVYATDECEIIQRWNTVKNTKLAAIKLPVGTSVNEIYYMDYPNIRMLVEGYTIPTTTYELNFETGKFTTKTAYQSMLDTSQFVTEKLYARSRDGSRIPFFVRYKKGLKLNGTNPTIMTGYGGFDRDVDPSCDNYDLVWMDLGGVCVEAILRGDAGLGADWRKAGTRESKQNTFDDFIAVAQALIRRKYTRPDRLGISGFSNGGLLTGAALTQRPDLFGAVEIGCGLLDMLRFHKFGTERHFELEYGTASTKKFFEILRGYSPLHNLRKRKYPAVLINTGSHDDRVSPAHSYKFAATLQELQQSDAPVLLNVEMNAGHGFHAQSYLGINRLSFFGYQLGLIPKALL